MAGLNWEPFVFLSDTHGDQIDRSAAAKAREFVEDWKPKHRIHGGDLFDLRPLRKGASGEERRERMQDDFIAGQELLEWYRPDTLLLGNHDVRVWEAMDSNCGATATYARDMVIALQGTDDREPVKEFGGMFRKLEIKTLVPYHSARGVYKLGDINMIHGFRATMYPAKAHSENYGPSVICGHVHKCDLHIPRHVDGGMAMSAPCLADLNMRYLDRSVAALAHDNGLIFGVVNNRTGKWEGWFLRRQRGENEWMDPRAKWT